MLGLFSNLHPFFAPDDPPVGGSKNLSVDEMVDFMMEDDEPETIPLTEPKKEGKKDGVEADSEDDTGDDTKVRDIGRKGKKDSEEDEEEESEEEDELKELEEEVEEPTEEQLELVTPVRRQVILKKYPNLFKDFPYLEKAYFREQQFTQEFPTIEDAKAAKSDSEALNRFESDVLDGNIGTILNSVKKENPESFYRIVDNYLLTLADIDQKAYLHVVGNVGKHTIMAMVQEAKASGNDALRSAAQILNQFLFMSSKFDPPTTLSKGKRPEEAGKEQEITQREQEIQKREFNRAHEGLNNRITNAITSTINQNIDPKDTMTEYIKKKASRDALETVEKQLRQDPRFRAIADKLWETAFKDSFSDESVDRIRRAYIAKAKMLLPSAIKKARIDALRGMGKRVREDDEETTQKGPAASGGRPRSQTSNSGKNKDPKSIPKGMTTLEFLNSD